jgi:hypothetical protein
VLEGGKVSVVRGGGVVRKTYDADLWKIHVQIRATIRTTEFKIKFRPVLFPVGMTNSYFLVCNDDTSINICGKYRFYFEPT